MAQPGAVIGPAGCLKKEAQVPANTCIYFNSLSRSAEPSSVCSRRTVSRAWRAKIPERLFFYRTASTAISLNAHIPPTTLRAFVCFD